VSNAWVTCLSLGDNTQKWVLIPHTLSFSHEREKKDLSVKDGPASD
jgi:hypothetical protein